MEGPPASSTVTATAGTSSLDSAPAAHSDAVGLVEADLATNSEAGPAGQVAEAESSVGAGSEAEPPSAVRNAREVAEAESNIGAAVPLTKEEDDALDTAGSSDRPSDDGTADPMSLGS